MTKSKKKLYNIYRRSTGELIDVAWLDQPFWNANLLYVEQMVTVDRD